MIDKNKMKLMMYVAGKQAEMKANALQDRRFEKRENELLAELRSERDQTTELKKKIVARWKPEHAELIVLKKQNAEDKKRKKNERYNPIRSLVRNAMTNDRSKTPAGAWNEFVCAVQSPSRPAFIFGYADGEVKYEHEDKDGNKTLKYFNRKAFDTRYYRIKKSA